MRTSKDGLDLIRHFEGCKLTAYKDAVGVWTLGYGHTNAAGLPKVRPGMKITAAEAEEILIADLVQYENEVRKAVKVPLRQYQFDALVSFCFNLGPTNLNRSTLLRKLNASDYGGAAEQFLVWNRAGGRVLAGLTRRRKAERAMFLGDKWR